MDPIQKGKSPFFPGQPVSHEFFVGRHEQIEKILTRGAGQVAVGKPVAMYIQGEYGIGKSSIANYVQWIAENKYELHGIYTSLGGVKNLEELAAAILQSVLESGAFKPDRAIKLRKWLAKYIGEQELFGFKINFEALKKDAPNLSSHLSLLSFLREVLSHLGETTKGLMLVLDEINGIASNPDFSHFIKGLVDQNALSKNPLPLFLLLCGVQERRMEMIKNHQPIDRIFGIIDIESMSQQEMRDFFERAFRSVQMGVTPDAMNLLIHYSAGFPKIMHLIGDSAFWRDRDGVIDTKDAEMGIKDAADEMGKKYVDTQIVSAIRSEDYHSILKKIGQLSPDRLGFKAEEISQGLTEAEKKKLHNFLQKMKKLNVIRSGETKGDYLFNLRIVRYYFWLKSKDFKK